MGNGQRAAGSGERAGIAAFGGMVLLLLLAVSAGWWQGTGTAGQVQVPMFYDAHYFFHRPWTQAQEAPGLPQPAPVGLSGGNRVTQIFDLEQGRAGLLKLHLAGSGAVVTLQNDRGQVWQTVVRPQETADRGGYVYFSLPPDLGQKGLWLTVAAETGRSALAGTVGGDRLGRGLRLNEFPRPGNLELATYSRGFPGRWWWETMRAQLLPAPFRTRLPQYKPAPFKGAVIPILVFMTILSSLGLWLAVTPFRPRRPAILTSAAALIALFLGFELLTGRLLLPLTITPVSFTASAAAVSIAPPPDEPKRLFYDWTAGLWTSQRRPEERFIAIAPLSPGAESARIEVPRQSSLAQTLLLPEGAMLSFGVAAAGAPLIARVRAGDQVLYEKENAPGQPPDFVTLDLSPFGGRAVRLTLETSNPNGPQGLEVDRSGSAIWLSPQITTEAPWLALPDLAAEEPLARLTAPEGEPVVRLLAAEMAPTLRPGEPLTIILSWRAEAVNDRYPTVFVHLRAGDGQIAAQNDSPPVGGTYPVAAWSPELVVADIHTLALPADLSPGAYELVAGLYEPGSFDRWRAAMPSGEPWPDNAVIIGRFTLP